MPAKNFKHTGFTHLQQRKFLQQSEPDPEAGNAPHIVRGIALICKEEEVEPHEPTLSTPSLSVVWFGSPPCCFSVPSRKVTLKMLVGYTAKIG